MNYGVRGSDGGLNLQATLSIASTGTLAERVTPHHPITCPGELRFEDDGTFACSHAEAPPDDTRRQPSPGSKTGSLPAPKPEGTHRRGEYRRPNTDIDP